MVWMSKLSAAKAATLVQNALRSSDDLRRHPYRGNKNYLAGHCYVASEVLRSILGDHWKPMFIRHESSPHWFLRNSKTGRILDVTSNQFDSVPDYSAGRGKGFLTKEPSARARELLRRVFL